MALPADVYVLIERADMTEPSRSAFREHYAAKPFVDRYHSTAEQGVDVIIPLIHTNELWRSNLQSIFREIPVRRMLLGNGGCIDDSIAIAQEFPRVLVLDHTGYVSLGYSLRKLIEAVETDWFVYLHSDVSLPPGWYDTMCAHRGQYDWYECRQQMMVLLEYPLVYEAGSRPYSGSQMGRTAVFADALPQIEDDYLYRNEDIILASLVERAGGRYGCVDDTFHYHQVMNKSGPFLRRVESVAFTLEVSRTEEIRTCVTQARGIIKYLEPTPLLARGVNDSIMRLHELGEFDWPVFQAWVAHTKPVWLRHIAFHPGRRRFREFVRAACRRVFGY